MNNSNFIADTDPSISLIFVQFGLLNPVFPQVIINSSHARFLCLGLASIAQTPLDNFMIKVRFLFCMIKGMNRPNQVNNQLEPVLGHVTGYYYQPIRDQRFLIRSFPD